MIRTIWFRVVLTLSTMLFSTLAIVFGLVRSSHAGYDWIHRWWSRSLLAAAGVRVKVEGLEHLNPRRGMILVANHQSYFDIWALMAVLPVSLRFIAKQELSKIRLLGSAMRAAGHVFIDRDRASTAGEAIRAAGERMRAEDLVLVLFPEGTRSQTGELGRFLRGSFGLAIETQVDLVPTAIAGGFDVFPPRGKRVTAGPVTVKLAPPVSLEGLGKTDRGRLMKETRATVEAMLEEIQTN